MSKESKPDTPRERTSPKKPSRKRAEQKRSVESRSAIIQAALAEFAEMGFEGASMRRIGDRSGMHYTLITYHFRTKEALWKAVAEHFFAEISSIWDESVPAASTLDPIDRIREEYRTFLRFILRFPDFHQFMVRESRTASPRLPWLMDTFIAPVMHRMIPQIVAAQKEGDLPDANPVLIHYLFIGVTSVLSALGAEIRYNSGVDPEDPGVANQYWRLVDQLAFKRRLYGNSETEPAALGGSVFEVVRREREAVSFPESE